MHRLAQAAEAAVAVSSHQRRPEQREGFRFFGNVKVGQDLEVEDLERHYHAIVFTVGCETDRQLGIPGEELPGRSAA